MASQTLIIIIIGEGYGDVKAQRGCDPKVAESNRVHAALMLEAGQGTSKSQSRLDI